MATDTAVASSTTPVDPTRHLWQLPALLLGVGVFVSAWQGWLPTGRNDPAAVFARDVTDLKINYEKLTPDPVELKAQLNKVASGVETYAGTEHAARARFHLASGYSRLAEITPALDESRGYWALARQHFALVTPEHLRDAADVPRLSFRAAKSGAAVGLPADAPAADIALLLQVLSAPPPGEEGGETRRLIADIAMRQTPPNPHHAKLSLALYLTAAGIATPPAALARARLRLANLHLDAREYEDARKWLAQIGGDAPADVLSPAKAALARLLLADGDHVGAAKELEVLRTAPGVPTQFRTAAAYNLGMCKLKARDPAAATKFFEEAVKGTGDEVPAASLRLADLHLSSTDPARHKLAAELLADAVKGVNAPGEYKNEHVPVAEVQAAFEFAMTVLLADRAFEPALKVADAYAVVSAAGRNREKRAEVLAAWAAVPKTNNAQSLFKQSADEFAALAAFQPKTDGKLEMLRRAASLYRQANEPASAVLRLKEAAKLPGIPEPFVGPVWVELADAMLAAGQTTEVWKIFNEVLASGPPASTATRYRIARQFVDSRHPGLVPVGRALFEQIAKQQNVDASEREYHERALTELANDLIRQGNFADAESRLRSQLQYYPTGPEVQLAKLLLGVCLLQKAAAPSTTTASATEMRLEAVALFKKIVAECDAVENRNGKLLDREAWLRLQAALRVLQTYQQLKKPNDLLAEADKLLDRYKDTVEELIIFSLMYHAFKQLNEPGKALTIRDRMRDVFDKLPPSAFPQQTGEYSRDYWLKVWFVPEQK